MRWTGNTYFITFSNNTEFRIRAAKGGFDSTGRVAPLLCRITIGDWLHAEHKHHNHSPLLCRFPLYTFWTMSYTSFISLLFIAPYRFDINSTTTSIMVKAAYFYIQHQQPSQKAIRISDYIAFWYLIFVIVPVSYTHLDVYKRQVLMLMASIHHSYSLP